MKFAAKIWGRFAASHKPAPEVIDMASVTLFSKEKQPEQATIHWLNSCVMQGEKGVFSDTILMNPGVAAELLRRNPDNRPFKWKAQHYAADMKAGRWTFNGEPILISRDGLVNDGQNRLLAIVESNTVQKMLVVFGLDRDSRLTVDQGVGRCAGDYLGMEGVKNAHNVASVSNGVLAYEAGKGERLITAGITNAQIRARAENDSGIVAAAEYAVSVYRYTRVFAGPKVIGTAFYILNDVDADDAKAFMDQVSLGEGIKRGDPAYAAREALMALGKGGLAAKLEIIFRGWVAYRTNRPLKMAKVLGSFPALV